MSAVDDVFVADVSDWPEDEMHPFYPEGSRDKRLLHCPDTPPHPALIPRHRYLFKQSRRAYPEQFWAEIVAYRIGKLSGVPVPPAHPACDSRDETCAALIEWFYGYADRTLEGFLSGVLFMKALIQDYDVHRGTQHNFHAVEEAACKTVVTETGLTHFRMSSDWPKAWARMLVFDALIGNTDRHQDNWGFLIDRGRFAQSMKPSLGPTANSDALMTLAPAFDNGTSLGHERPADQFHRFDDHNYLDRYISKGRHHMRWKIDDPTQAGHFDLLAKLVDRYSDTRSTMLSVIDFDPHTLRQEIHALTRLQLPVPLSRERADFMLTLTLARRERIASTLKP